MPATAPWENHPTWKDGRCKLIVQKKPVRLKEWMIDRNSFLQIWKTTLKNERLQADIWKNILPLQNLIPQINPPNNSCSQKQQYSNKKIKAKLNTPKEQLFGDGSFSEGHPSKCEVYYCFKESRKYQGSIKKSRKYHRNPCQIHCLYAIHGCECYSKQ